MNYANRFYLKNLSKLRINKNVVLKKKIKKCLLNNSNLRFINKFWIINTKKYVNNKNFNLCNDSGYKRSVFKKTSLSRLILKKKIESGNLVNFTAAEW